MAGQVGTMIPRPPCETCDSIGPDETRTQADLRAFHRAWADLGWALADAIHLQQFADWLSDRLSRKAN